MREILTRDGREVLRRLASSRLLLAFDFDGTLAPIVSDPDRAAIRSTTRTLLGRLARQYPCVIISGRARADVVRRLHGVPAVEVVGNHGIEPWLTSRRSRTAVRRWRPALSRCLTSLPGVMVEDKEYSIAVHYRHSPEKKKVRSAIDRVVSALGDVRLIRGKQVVNLLPNGAPHKGVALERARARFGCDTAVYVGDDDTDEDVFALDEPGRVLTIRIGRRRGSLASHFIKRQADIDRFLRVMLALAPER